MYDMTIDEAIELTKKICKKLIDRGADGDMVFAILDYNKLVCSALEKMRDECH